MFKNSDYHLCYIAGPWAYFTTRSVLDETGPGWGMIPYAHESEPPYVTDAERAAGIADIIKIAFDDCGVLYRPNEPAGILDTVTVYDINRGKAPWLRSFDWANGRAEIMAGMTFPEVALLIEQAGGQVYLKTQAKFIGGYNELRTVG